MNPNDEELAALRERHPGWQIWRVDRYLGGPLWCARPLGQTQPVLNAGRPGSLSELIEAKEAGLTATGPAPERDRRSEHHRAPEGWVPGQRGRQRGRVRAGHAPNSYPAAGDAPSHMRA